MLIQVRILWILCCWLRDYSPSYIITMMRKVRECCSWFPVNLDHVRILEKLHPQTHIKRQETQHDCLLGDVEKWIEILYGEEKIVCTGPARAAKAGQKSLVLTRQAQQTNQGRTPFICCTLWVPIHLSFNSQQGPPLSSLSATSPLAWMQPQKCKLCE